MTDLAYRMEIMAEDIDEVPGALWTRKNIEANRWSSFSEYDFSRIVVGVDPTGTATGDECGIVVCARDQDKYPCLRIEASREDPNGGRQRW